MTFPALWIAAPLTGLLVQPIVGHLSDRTWLGRLGRRRPYFLAGALLATLSLLLMPIAGQLFMAAVLLWTLDASLNISMEPFRAFVGDMLRTDQHAAGYAVQTAFIGAGAVVGSNFRRLLDAARSIELGGCREHSATRFATASGSARAALFLAVLWTVLTTREHSPEDMARFGEIEDPGSSDEKLDALARARPCAKLCLDRAGASIVAGVLALRPSEGNVPARGRCSSPMASRASSRSGSRGVATSTNMLANIVGDFSGMPAHHEAACAGPVLQLVRAVHHVGLHDAGRGAAILRNHRRRQAPRSRTPAIRSGELFAIYNGVAAIAALTLLPWLSRRIGKAPDPHRLPAVRGRAAFASFFWSGIRGC